MLILELISPIILFYAFFFKVQFVEVRKSRFNEYLL